MTYSFWRFARRLFITVLVLFSALTIGVLYYIEFELPDIDALNNVQLQVPLQIYSSDGKLIAEYGEKRRIPIPYDQIPKPLIDAVLATEDQRYFQHPGIDIPGLMRAAVKLAVTGRKEQGGSTITMQVARSFYLTRNKTFGRKLREILLALKINHKLSKEKILELYFNKIFLGYRAYGVGAAAEVYYGKQINDLTLSEYAMLAGLPKAPSALNPLANPEAAKKRRNHVLARMYELGYINAQAYRDALRAPLNASYHDFQTQVKAPYVGELVRQQLEQMYGDAIYTDGFKVYTTVNSRLQNAANQSVHDGLIAYDQRHGYRGPERNLGNPTPKRMVEWEKILHDVPKSEDLEPGAVVQIGDKSVTVLRANGSLITIPWAGMSWARKQINSDYLGHRPNNPADILRLGDIIRITAFDGTWHLAQIPKAEAGMVALSPVDGAILAMVGGFDFQSSKFNRITNALRQPGSSFKPFIYAAALDKGYTLATVINDAPVVIENPYDNSLWRPQNDTKKFYGPTRLREALIHSRNLVSIRLLDIMGIPYAVSYIQRFGFTSAQLPPTLSLALGTANVSPLQLASGYAIFANGGFKIVPFAIRDIRNMQGQVIYQAHPLAACSTCPDAPTPQPAAADAKKDADKTAAATPPVDNTHAPRVISAQDAFLVSSALHDVIQFGTATKARSLKRVDLSGKTGTTNNQVDAWFAGYNQNIVAISWVGFDQPQSLHEYGAQAALPLWIEFMQSALQGQPDRPLEQPAGIVNMRIDPRTGLRASAGDPTAIFEYFMTPFVPTEDKAAGPAPVASKVTDETSGESTDNNAADNAQDNAQDNSTDSPANNQAGDSAPTDNSDNSPLYN